MLRTANANDDDSVICIFKLLYTHIYIMETQRILCHSLILESLNASAVLMTSTKAWSSNRRSSVWWSIRAYLKAVCTCVEPCSKIAPKRIWKSPLVYLYLILLLSLLRPHSRTLMHAISVLEWSTFTFIHTLHFII